MDTCQEPNNPLTPKLDSISNNNITAVLSSTKKISGRGGTTVANETEKTGNKRKDREKGEITPTISLRRNEYLAVEFIVPRSRRPGVRYVVESDFPVDVYLLNQDNLKHFENDEQFSYIIRQEDRTYYDEDINLPYAGLWFLIIWNTSNKRVAIHHDLYI